MPIEIIFIGMGFIFISKEINPISIKFNGYAYGLF